MSGARAPEAGFSLIEVLVSLALFALIGIAGFAVLDGVLRVQARTEGRLDRLADLQRALHLMTSDLEQAAGPLKLDGADGLTVARFDARSLSGRVGVGYALRDGALVRTLADDFGGVRARQPLLGDVAGLSWSVYAPGAGWIDRWPPETGKAAPLPRAVRAKLTLAPGRGLAGEVERVVLLPRPAAP